MRLAALALAVSVGLAGPVWPEIQVTRERPITVTAPPGISLVGDGVTVLLGGVQQQILSLSPTAGSWRIVLYFDPLLATTEGIRSATEALSREAGVLVRLGHVEVVTSDPFPNVLAGPTRDVDVLREALRIVAEEADSAGEFTHLRQDFLELRRSGDVSPQLARDAFERETELLLEQQKGLLTWLASEAESGPHCLVLVQNGFDLESGRFYQEATNDPLQSSEAVTSHDRMTRLLSSLGWTVVASVNQPPILATPANNAALESLVRATAGELVTGWNQLTTALERLSRRQEAIVRLSGTADGEPRSFELRARGADALIRAPLWLSVATPPEVSQARARRTLEELAAPAGRFGVHGALGAKRQGSRLQLAVLTDLRGSGLEKTDLLFRVSWLVEPLEGGTVSAHHVVAVPDLTEADGWLYRAAVELPEEVGEAAVVVEELRTGAWAAALVELSGAPLETTDLRIVDLGSAVPATPIHQPVAESVIRLLPPIKQPATGKVRFRTLASHPGIAQVDFYLDDQIVGSDTSPPFGWVVELDSPPRPQSIAVVAYSADAAELGRHSLTVNRSVTSFEVRIARISGDPAQGSVEVEAAVTAPAGNRIARVEVFRNDELAARLTAPPWRAKIATPDPTLQDFVRVVAYLDDGSSLEDARLIVSPAAQERLEVNLVELNVVVLDSDERPLTNLTRADFGVRLRGRQQQIERFALADQVPLVLGLVMDTSESMWPLMPDAKQAGAQFLSQTLRDADRAFLVDFDTKPRLSQPATTDLLQLMRRFNALQADGFTALYDAIIFSMTHFEEEPGRKALVLLTDGDDYRSRFGPKRCIQLGRQLGVPVYIISLAALRDLGPWSPSGRPKAPATPTAKPPAAVRRIVLEGITEATGGKIFYITATEQLSEAYARINQELRNQYVLAFATDRQLSQDELSKLRVEVPGRDVTVRTVVGGQRID